jgi:hypothetical protein
METELLKKARFNVSLKCGDHEVKVDNISYDSALALFEDFYQQHGDNEDIQRAYSSVKRSFGFMSSSGPGYDISISAGLPRIKGTEPQTCGRRMSELGPWKREDGLDTWNKIGEDRVCSFCGSMHPEDLLALIKQKGMNVVQGTDKGYKFYVSRPEIPNASFGAIKYYTHHNTPEFVEEYNKLLLASKQPAE